MMDSRIVLHDVLPPTHRHLLRGTRIISLSITMSLTLLQTGCSMFAPGAKQRREITETLERQDAAWNEGDLTGFMQPYWKSPDLTFSAGGSVTRGWQDTYDRYKTKYPDRKAMGRLHFSDLEITFPSRSVALVLGRWGLEGEKAAAGSFSLVMRRDHGQWVIIHDHSSSDSH